MFKTVEVKEGFEKEFEDYLENNHIENQSCTLSSGMMFWEIRLENDEELKNLEKLPYLYLMEDTPIIRPS